MNRDVLEPGNEFLPLVGNGFTVGPQVRALDQLGEYDITAITTYISTVLQQIRRQNSYGILAGIEVGKGPLVPTLIFGFPEEPVAEVLLPSTPYNLPLLILQDSIIFINELDTPWATSPICDIPEITLESLSIGIEGSVHKAGSFGGFLRWATSPDEVYGIIAAHCVPGAAPGVSVCCPSTLEITSRFDRLLRYTTLCPPESRLHYNLSKQLEAESILARFRFQSRPSGVTFLDQNLEPKTGVFSGAPLGDIVSLEFGKRTGLLHEYDKRLEGRNLPTFGAEGSWETRTDWCIFSCHANRFGGNRYEEETIEQTGDLYPGASVEKVGRTTGIQCGKVNRVMLQRWDTGHITHEIAIVGAQGPFALKGDSGGCVLVKENGTNQAAGILIGNSSYNSFTLVTPLNIILDCASDFQWA